jgi:plastocyanin/heme-degrading monooxygenase HmoA
MEYIQTVLVQVAANKLDDALAPTGLISELEAHRDFAAGQRGFLGMRVTRTANPEGNVLVVAETRWANNNTMADYSTLKNNVEAIIGRHEGEIVAGSLQVHRMESSRTEAAEAPDRVYDRLALALFIPVGVLAFSLLVIYAMSRIYLILPGDSATPLAAVATLAILGIAWYFSANPSVPRGQLGAVVLAFVALGVGGTAAAVYDDKNHEVKAPPTPPVASASPGAGPTAAPGQASIDMKDNSFSVTEITIKSGDTINLTNSGQAAHNIQVALTDENYSAPYCKTTGPAPCSNPALVMSGKTATITVSLPAGTYNFRCDYHPAEMKGKITVT